MSIAMLDTFLPGSLPSALQQVGFGSTDLTLLFGAASFCGTALQAGSYSVTGAIIGGYKLLTIILSPTSGPATASGGVFSFTNPIINAYRPISSFVQPISFRTGNTAITGNIQIGTNGIFSILTSTNFVAPNQYSFNITVLYL